MIISPSRNFAAMREARNQKIWTCAMISSRTRPSETRRARLRWHVIAGAAADGPPVCIRRAYRKLPSTLISSYPAPPAFALRGKNILLLYFNSLRILQSHDSGVTTSRTTVTVSTRSCPSPDNSNRFTMDTDICDPFGQQNYPRVGLE